MCWNSTGSPPRDGSKKPNPKRRSMATSTAVRPMTGVASTWMMLVA
jgi:hypothetical protein